jgi:hypothetical protein
MKVGDKIRIKKLHDERNNITSTATRKIKSSEWEFANKNLFFEINNKVSDIFKILNKTK